MAHKIIQELHEFFCEVSIRERQFYDNISDEATLRSQVIDRTESIQALTQRILMALLWITEIEECDAQDLVWGRALERELRVTEKAFRQRVAHNPEFAVEIREIPYGASMANLRSGIVKFSDQIRQRVDLDVVENYKHMRNTQFE